MFPLGVVFNRKLLMGNLETVTLSTHFPGGKVVSFVRLFLLVSVGSRELSSSVKQWLYRSIRYQWI